MGHANLLSSLSGVGLRIDPRVCATRLISGVLSGHENGRQSVVQEASSGREADMPSSNYSAVDQREPVDAAR